MTLTRRRLIASGLSVPLVGLYLTRPAAAQALGDVLAQVLAGPVDPPTGEIPAVFTRGGLAVSGYDTVAYFTDGQPRPGSDAYRLRWRGAIWRFATSAHRDAFEMNPATYAPQFGGYCAYTVANGYPMKSEPDVWTIHEGRLYLNFNASIKAMWQRDIAHYIEAARENWRRFDKS